MTKHKLPTLIVTLLRYKIPVTIAIEDGVIVYKLEGFYKSGGVTIIPQELTEEEETFRIRDRYKEQEAYNICDLVYLNASWWESSRDRNECWEQPDPLWASLLLSHGYIEEVPPGPVVTQYRPKKV